MGDEIEFKIEEKSDQLKKQVMNLLHEYPDHFIHGLFESSAEEDFQKSIIACAHRDSLLVGCLMYSPINNEFNWLATKRHMGLNKQQIAKGLFETGYKTIPKGTAVHLFVNTEDASIPGTSSFSGKNFDPARDFYRSIGLEIKEENRIENKYGPGAHAYKVSWVPNS